MSDNRLSETLQTITHALVVGAGLVYLFGFIIISVFDATYGIADFALFRTKVVAVGTLFVVLVALAMLLTFRMFSFFGLTSDRAEGSEFVVLPQNWPFRTTDAALSLPFGCVGLTYPLIFLFSKYPEWRRLGFVLFVVTVAILTALGVFGRKWFNAHPILFVALMFLNTVSLFLVLFRYADRIIFWFVVWLSSVCVFTLYTSFKVRNPEQLRKTQWERVFLLAVPFVFFIYATKVYPGIKHEFGGGAPVPVILHFNKKLPVFDSTSVPVYLLDETEQGYYVLRGSDKAAFVTRTLVDEVEFKKESTAQSASPNP